MPKQIFKIENFHGGLSTDADPRDIADNELPVLTDAVVDEVGKVRMMGGNAAHGAPDPENHTIRAGHGLFYFTADRKGAHVHEDDLSGVNSVGVASVTVSAGGGTTTPFSSGPAITFGAPNVSGGVRATGTSNISGGGVTSITMTNNGSGYTSVPSCTGSGVRMASFNQL